MLQLTNQLTDLAEIEVCSRVHMGLEAPCVQWLGVALVVKFIDSEGLTFFCFSCFLQSHQNRQSQLESIKTPFRAH